MPDRADLAAWLHKHRHEWRDAGWIIEVDQLRACIARYHAEHAPPEAREVVDKWIDVELPDVDPDEYDALVARIAAALDAARAQERERCNADMGKAALLAAREERIRCMSIVDKWAQGSTSHHIAAEIRAGGGDAG